MQNENYGVENAERDDEDGPVPDVTGRGRLGGEFSNLLSSLSYDLS